MSETAPENMASKDIRDILAAAREGSRAALVQRLAARADRPPGNTGMVQFSLFARDLSDRQIADWHVLLDHQEARPPAAGPASLTVVIQGENGVRVAEQLRKAIAAHGTAKAVIGQ